MEFGIVRDESGAQIIISTPAVQTANVTTCRLHVRLRHVDYMYGRDSELPCISRSTLCIPFDIAM